MCQQFDQDANVEFSYTFQEMIVEIVVAVSITQPDVPSRAGFQNPSCVIPFHPG